MFQNLSIRVLIEWIDNLFREVYNVGILRIWLEPFLKVFHSLAFIIDIRARRSEKEKGFEIKIINFICFFKANNSFLIFIAFLMKLAQKSPTLSIFRIFHKVGFKTRNSIQNISFLQKVIHKISWSLYVSKLILLRKHSKWIYSLGLNDTGRDEISLCKWILLIFPKFNIIFYFFLTLFPNVLHDFLFFDFSRGLLCNLIPGWNKLLKFVWRHFICIPNLSVFKSCQSFFCHHWRQRLIDVHIKNLIIEFFHSLYHWFLVFLYLHHLCLIFLQLMSSQLQPPSVQTLQKCHQLGILIFLFS